MPTVAEPRTPQRLGNWPITLGKNRRRAHVARQVAQTRLHIARNRLILPGMLPGMPRAVEALKAAKTQLGLPYRIAGCRCSEYCYARDCSGLIYYGINHVSPGPDLCGSSFSLARIGQEYGTIISREEALWTPGAIGIRCPFCDSNFNGSNGHTWYCEGDGEHSIEEGGRRTGCYRGSADKPGDVIFIKYPGLDYSTAPIDLRERTMFVQTHHYNIASGAETGRTTPPDSRDSIISVAMDGSAIECNYDASIANDQPVDPAHPKRLRRWVSPGEPLPAGVKFIAVTERVPTPKDHHPGGVALLSNGDCRRFHLS